MMPLEYAKTSENHCRSSQPQMNEKMCLGLLLKFPSLQIIDKLRIIGSYASKYNSLMGGIGTSTNHTVFNTRKVDADTIKDEGSLLNYHKCLSLNL